MADETNFQLPTEEEIDFAELDDIIAEFSEYEEEDTPTGEETYEPEEVSVEEPVRRSPLKIVFAVCLSIMLVAALAVGSAFFVWYQRYKAAQPEQKSVDVFAQLFQDPDWAMLYTVGGLQDTAFENRETFIRYMTAATQQQSLKYMELPRENEFQRRYCVFSGDTAIGEFTMVGIDDTIPQWNLYSVEFFLQRDRHVSIEKAPGATAFINGIPVDNTYIIRSSSTLAEDFLPEGTHGYRMEQLLVTGLMLEPEVVVLNPDGSIVEMEYNSETCAYSPKAQTAPQMTDAHRQFALDAAKTCAAFAVRANSFADLRQYFDPNSTAYEEIGAQKPLMEGCATYAFDESATQVINFHTYGSNLFSVTVAVKLDVTVENGDASSYDMSWHFLCRQNPAGGFLITQISQQPLHTLREQVRLTLMLDGKELDSMMVASDETVLQFPRVTAPEGKVFAGWGMEITDAEGNAATAVLFAPSASNMVHLAPGNTLEPMTLHAIFQDAD